MTLQEDGYVTFIAVRTASTTLHEAPFRACYTPFYSEARRHFISLLILRSPSLSLKPFWLAYLCVFKSFLLRDHHFNVRVL
jgi:hypothetical protein